MSFKELPPRPNLDQLKKQAKELHRSLKAKDPDALQRFKNAHPNKIADAETFSLNDAYFVLAREYGYSSWPKLKKRIDVMNDPVAMFLSNAVHGNTETSYKIMVEYSDAIQSDFVCACVLGEYETIQSKLRDDPSLAQKPQGPRNAEPLFYLCFSPFHRESDVRAQGILNIARLLLQHGANPNASVKADGWTPTAIYGAAGFTNHPRLAQLLLETGADPNDNESLYHSTEFGDHACMKLLLKHNAAVKGTNALPHIIDRNDTEGARILLEHGADPNETLGENETALHWAVKRGCSAQLVDLLLEHGVDIEAKNAKGQTAYVYANRTGETKLALHLAKRGAQDLLADQDHFIAACLRSDRDAALAMVKENPNFVRNLPASEMRAVSDAGWKCNCDALSLMTELGFDLNARGEHGATALHWACWFGMIGLVELILRYSPPLEAVCVSFGSTPLGWTAHGADNCRNPKGDYVAVAKTLVNAGAKINIANKWNENLFPEKHSQLADYLRSQGATR